MPACKLRRRREKHEKHEKRGLGRSGALQTPCRSARFVQPPHGQTLNRFQTPHSGGLQAACGRWIFGAHAPTLRHLFPSLVAVFGAFLDCSCIFPAWRAVPPACLRPALLGAGGGAARTLGGGASGLAERSGGRAGAAVHGARHGVGGRGRRGPGRRSFPAAGPVCACGLPVVRLHAAAAACAARACGGAGAGQRGAPGSRADRARVAAARGGSAPPARLARARAAPLTAFLGEAGPLAVVRQSAPPLKPSFPLTFP